MINLKLQLDTTKKTIKIDEDVKLTKLMSVVKRLLPNGEWMDFTLQTNTVIEHWTQPYRWYWNEPVYPWYTPVTYTATNLSLSSGSGPIPMGTSSNTNAMIGSGTLATLTSGVYNIEVK